jgi:DNA-binding response OmpR family regulator
VPQQKNYRAVLVVEEESAALSGWVRALRQAGYQATGVSTFEEARRQMMQTVPDALITKARLGAYNALHLVYLGARESPPVQAVVVGDEADPILEREVIGAGAAFLVKPVYGAQIVAAVEVLVGAPTAEGSPRGLGAGLVERRWADRRKVVIPGFQPERRMAERRAPPID